jgi:hypothetical protein
MPGHDGDVLRTTRRNGVDAGRLADLDNATEDCQATGVTKHLEQAAVEFISQRLATFDARLRLHICTIVHMS